MSRACCMFARAKNWCNYAENQMAQVVRFKGRIRQGISAASQTGVQMCTPMSFPQCSTWRMFKEIKIIILQIGLKRCHSWKGQKRFVYSFRFSNFSPNGFGGPPHFFTRQPIFHYLKTCTGTQIIEQNHCNQLTPTLISLLKCSSLFWHTARDEDQRHSSMLFIWFS